ncbi:DUF3549 family protein [Vibrio sp. V27_P1S3P104]|uniref:DUF3549 family protein n=1 Tax=Vibrio TaxID=662 RepID=UPI000C171F39|nr:MULTISPECIES: DUF3549 family protein [Vibrio]NAW68394.1 DUF3549 family protein [Vibrio sp. V28_P6S34P95]NAX05500.1 DUF3549 family protein [Vibrio sp. V30_P3S12P165]NAX33893.1 DUF3549 family protein [Vibrio sp. V29_P1S30P107]NAX38205.1 DUF3549 family protein [Vibrio sp. V27_P1S3P104]NAX40592.1 DUF3549 family protein [Vibrio sp. V26_P1S5P106]
MQPIHPLTTLLKQSGCQYLVFDLGRRIQPIEAKQFQKIEQGQQPYPYPLQRQAHLAIVYWNEHQQPWIWFTKFPLDERGLLIQAEINQFIQYVIEAMGSRLQQTLTEEQQQKLANNPYTFQPTEEKMAVLHSQIRAQLHLPTSQYYEHAQHYFSGGLGWENWQTVGLQGISDIGARLRQQNNSVFIRKALDHLPSSPLYALLGVLEHVNIPDNIASKLYEMANQQMSSSQTDLFLLSALVRALSGATPNYLAKLTDAILATPDYCHQEVLIGLAGRAWSTLRESGRAQRFLLRLVQTENQTLFNRLFADLVMLPELRMVLLPLLHTSPSPELAKALLQLQRSTKQSS